jgi:DNA-binding beta-propeller fold protein YncE
LQSYPQLQNLTGANSSSVTLSPDKTQLYVTNGNLNSVAVVQLTGADKGHQIVGLIPESLSTTQVAVRRQQQAPLKNC